MLFGEDGSADVDESHVGQRRYQGWLDWPSMARPIKNVPLLLTENTYGGYMPP